MNLANEIAKHLTEYTNQVTEDLEVAKSDVAKNLVSELKQKSPKLTGSYAKGWRVKEDGSSLVVHNKTDYQLTHLLEHGHAKVGGGRVPAQVHIRPAEERAIKEFEERVEKAIKS